MDLKDGGLKQAFGPEAVSSINRAYVSALDRLGIYDAHSDGRAGVAKIIMDLAQAGETDEAQLRDRAVQEWRRTSRSTADIADA